MTDAAASPPPLYERRGDLLHPSPNACGPWFPDVQHGAAIAGLIGRAVDQAPSPVPMQLSQLSIDLTRRVPMGPVRTEVDVVRDGKRVQALAVRLLTENGAEVSRATAIRIRAHDGIARGPYVGLPYPDDTVPPPPETGKPVRMQIAEGDLFNCFDVRDVGNGEIGRTVWWFRFTTQFVGGEVLTPTVRLCVTADLVMSTATIMAQGEGNYLTINPDLTILPHRLPDGDWIAMRSEARAEQNGVGQSDGVIFDRRGRLGRSLKSQLIDPR